MDLSVLAQLDLNLLVALQALIEEGSVSGAAKRLSVSQPAMSRTLQRLRDSLGDPLFVRTGRGLRPTARTAALRDPLQTSLAELGVLLAPSEFDPRTTERHVVLGTSDYGAQTSLPAVIEQLASEAPGLSIEVRNWQLSMLGEMSGSDIDLVLSTVPRQTPAQMRLRRLGSDHLVCVMRRGHPLGRRKSLSLADYLAYAHILITMGGDARGTTDRLLEPLGKRRRVALRCPHFLPSFTIVSRTDYLLTAPRFLAERLRSELSLTLAKLPFKVPEFHYALLWHERMHSDHGHRWIRQRMAEIISAQFGDSDGR